MAPTSTGGAGPSAPTSPRSRWTFWKTPAPWWNSGVGGWPRSRWAATVRSRDRRFIVLAHGTPDSGPQAGLKRSDTLKKVGYDAIMLARHTDIPVLIVTSHLPTKGRCATHLARLGRDVVDVVATEGDLAGFQRLRALFGDRGPQERLAEPPPAWRTIWDQLELFGDDGGSRRA